MKLLKKQRILTVATVSALMLVVSACSEKMTHHETMHNKMMTSVKQANSKADHEQLAKQFDQEAAMLLKKAQRHEQLATEYEQTDNSKMVYGADAAKHCRKLAQKYREAATENKALADLHRQQAKKSK